MSLIIPYGPSNEKLKKFEGTPYFNITAMNYLNNKFDNHCVIIPHKRRPNEHTQLSLRWVQTVGTDGYLNVPPAFWKEFRKHLNHAHDTSIIVFPFGFSCAKSGGHANIMLYDIKTKTLERFDSNGEPTSACLKSDVDKKILEIFRHEMGHDFVKHYMKPFTASKIFQELQDAEDSKKLKTDPKYGFCSVWSCFYADLRMSNPTIPRHRLIKDSLDELLEDGSLTEFIREYSQLLVKHSKSNVLKSYLKQHLKTSSKRRSKSLRRRSKC